MSIEKSMLSEIDDVTLEAEVRVTSAMCNSYLKALSIMENASESTDLSDFEIFQEASKVVDDPDNASWGFSDEFRRFSATKGKKENILKSILLFIPRLIAAIIRQVNKLFRKGLLKVISFGTKIAGKFDKDGNAVIDKMKKETIECPSLSSMMTVILTTFYVASSYYRFYKDGKFFEESTYKSISHRRQIDNMYTVVKRESRALKKKKEYNLKEVGFLLDGFQAKFSEEAVASIEALRETYAKGSENIDPEKQVVLAKEMKHFLYALNTLMDNVSDLVQACDVFEDKMGEILDEVKREKHQENYDEPSEEYFYDGDAD